MKRIKGEDHPIRVEIGVPHSDPNSVFLLQGPAALYAQALVPFLRKRNVLVYLTYSDRLIDGSPQNSVTAVPMGEVVFPRN